MLNESTRGFGAGVAIFPMRPSPCLMKLHTSEIKYGARYVNLFAIRRGKSGSDAFPVILITIPVTIGCGARDMYSVPLAIGCSTSEVKQGRRTGGEQNERSSTQRYG